ncbi:MAG: acetate--CoA ligase, partial [Ignavibacteria bacterium]|nr:acetate--CoA ligase [Ignavibacteria bacterium]
MLSKADFDKLHKESISDRDNFWKNKADNLFWYKKWDKVFEDSEFGGKWFVGGKTNITYNCLDKNIQNGNGNNIAYIWTNEEGNEQKISYSELLIKVNKTANFLNTLGIKKGEIVTIYMPSTIDQVVSMLACARLGIVHSVVFAGFSFQALQTRIVDAKSKYVITSDYAYRKGKSIDLISTVRKATENISDFQKLIVFKRDQKTELNNNEINLYEEIKLQSDNCDPVWMDSEETLFI